MKIPQLRILVTSFCGRKCIYCRPTGEGSDSCSSKVFIDMEDALKICRLYREKGGTEVKITGGDPVFWPDLVPFVHCLKNQIGFPKVEVITRSPKISEKMKSLVASGMDVLNFSLDTTSKNTYEQITGCYDYDTLIVAIQDCAKVVPVKINSVIMKGINDSNIKELVAFCESAGVQQLKLLDVIDDLQDIGTGNSSRLHELGIERLNDLYVSLAPICEEIKKDAILDRIVYQGGLGHPMNEFKMASGLTITVKNSENGAWYGKPCENCPSYPCHDALMAIRLTPSNGLQYCLLNDQATVSLNGLTAEEIAHIFCDALSIFENACFVK